MGGAFVCIYMHTRNQIIVCNSVMAGYLITQKSQFKCATINWVSPPPLDAPLTVMAADSTIQPLHSHRIAPDSWPLVVGTSPSCASRSRRSEQAAADVFLYIFISGNTEIQLLSILEQPR